MTFGVADLTGLDVTTGHSDIYHRGRNHATTLGIGIRTIGGGGGGGGGAVEIGAIGPLHIEEGSVRADGGDGGPGTGSLFAMSTGGGGGGGSGGGVLLHAGTLTLAGLVDASGGRGGSGDLGGGGGGGGGRVAARPSALVYVSQALISVAGGVGGTGPGSGLAGQPGAVDLSAPVLIIPTGQFVQLASGTLVGGVAGHPFTLQGLRVESGALVAATGGYTANGAVTLRQGGQLAVSGGMTTQHDLVLEGGVLSTPGGLGLSGTGAVSGFGQVFGVVSGGASSRITSAGGTLTLGDANSAAGFSFGRTTQIGAGSTLDLHDADQALLGPTTTINAGGRLASLNGTELGAGQVLSASSAATIDGTFTNQGVVNGPTAAARFLTFIDDVDGAGGYTGNIRFSDGFSPGGSPAIVTMENAIFDATASLLMEIGGLLAGAEHDQLRARGLLALDGTLDVVLISGFTPRPGQVFDVLDWGTLSGTFAAVNLPGLEAGLAWDTSNLYVTGAIAVQQVSEPSLLVLAAAGLGVSAAAARRRRRAELAAIPRRGPHD